MLKLLLEAIYDSSMSENSHGFRPGRSQHSALRSIRKNFGGVKWFVEGDITKFFCTMDWGVLMRILSIRIKDSKILNLIRAGLKAKIILPDGQLVSPDRGTPQGGVLSPLLSNIYLDQMDTFIEEYKKGFDRGVKRRNSLAYNRITKKSSASVAHKKGIRKTDPQDPN